MIIEICSQKSAIEQAPHIQDNTSIISIVSSDERDVIFCQNDKIGGILHLKFNDLKAEYDDEGIPYGRPLPRSKDLAGLRQFVEGLQCDRLLVHCWEGSSRSAAVAAAVYEFRGSTDTMLIHNRIAPNPLVYRLACSELGIHRSDMRYRMIPEGLETWKLETF